MITVNILELTDGNDLAVSFIFYTTHWIDSVTVLNNVHSKWEGSLRIDLLLRLSWKYLKGSYNLATCHCTLSNLWEAYSTQRTAFKEFYTTANVAKWYDSTYWNDDATDLNKWYGVTASTSDDGVETVLSLNLSSNNLLVRLNKRCDLLTKCTMKAKLLVLLKPLNSLIELTFFFFWLSILILWSYHAYKMALALITGTLFK
jgi:hypothetical protein